ncbi:unnamed protein product [Paramecium pentaurelia]|uniref:Uncharacterized protein n=1 Tax=Paramecium pentaurelia TaxID=43138 RepID=A0A8S1UU49_9CILI|nr:unnamed protein product [Paramecium pentaurelia]
MIFDLQPPSPSLSPNSRVRYYQEQLDKAHEIIDQLEILLQEKELQKQQDHPSSSYVPIPPLQFHCKSPSVMSERSKSYVATPQQYSTPRDLRNRMSMGNQNSIKYIEEMKTRHSELVLQFKEDNTQRELKNKEINDHIQELKTELIYCQEKQTMTKKEKKQSQQQLEVLQNEIENIQSQLQKSREQGLQLLQKLQQYKQDTQEIELEQEQEIILQDQQTNSKLETPDPSKKRKYKNSTSHKKLMQSLQQEIELLEAQKKHYYNNSISNFQEKEIETNLINDEIIEPKQNQRIDTLDDMRLVTDSGFKFNTQIDHENESVRSFKIKKQKPRSCESCIIF